jgi:hypothetical protein
MKRRSARYGGSYAGPGAVLDVLSALQIGPARAELPVHHDLPFAVALIIAQGAVESCAAKGYAESAVVVDRDGETIVAIRGDNAAPQTMPDAKHTPPSASASPRRLMPSVLRTMTRWCMNK